MVLLGILIRFALLFEVIIIDDQDECNSECYHYTFVINFYIHASF